MKPTDDTLALAAFLFIDPHHPESWFYTDELRHAIAKLGFEMPSSQWITARLTAMTKERQPRFERREAYSGTYCYRVTSWAETGLKNTWPGFIQARRSLPTPLPDPKGDHHD